MNRLMVMAAVLLTRDAERAAERDALQGCVDIRKTADDALRASDGDTRPVDERPDEHGRLR